jgi:SAM-dependent methyltransferase
VNETRELLLGCGHSREKQIKPDANPGWTSLTTLDNNPSTLPDVVHDLDVFPYPFLDETFDEIHAYEVLEHTGTQGDVKFFFKQFMELYRMLKPDGQLFISVPQPDSPWVWGDPSHRRIMHPFQFLFLDREYYKQEGTPVSDFLSMWEGDFTIIHSEVREHRFYIVLKKRNVS